ncbi:MAG: tetratricopeptide repeat protein [Bacteroidales bacterium]|nr:tetratricopeptide repeat protein [Bacteroidales bacterium]
MKEDIKNHSQSDTSIQENAEKQDKNLQIGDIISKTQLFIEKNKKTLIIIVSAIVLLVVAFCLYKFWYVPSQEKNAENEMFAAEYYFMQEDYNKALKGDGKHAGFIAISEDYSRTRHGKLAKFYIGRIYLEQGKYQEAISYFEGFNPKDAFMASQNKALIADCYWELNNLDKAISYYNDAASTEPNNFTTPAILMKLAAAYEVKKDFKKALECYNKIKTEYPRSPEFAQIEKYISRMEALLGK